MQIQNPEAAQIIRDQAGLTIAEGFPQNLLPNVQPVMDMTPDIQKKSGIFSSSRATSGASTIRSVPAGKKFYATGAYITYYADASCDCVELWIGCVQNGVTSTRLFSAHRVSLVANADTVQISFSRPIPIDAGTSITLNQSYTVGSLTSRMTVFGYEA